MSFRKPKPSGKGGSFASDADFNIINEKFIQIVGSAKNASSAIKDFNKYLEESKYSKTAATNIEEIINSVFNNATQKMEALKAEIASAEKSVRSADTALNGAKGAKNAYNVAFNA
jgi:C4-type Zn-finger protein